jgi:hypothetical protein
MARNDVKDWADFMVPAEGVATIRAVIVEAFKAAGGRGDLPKALNVRGILRGVLSCDAAAFEAGNVEDDSEVANAEAWALAILSGAGTLDALAAWPGMQKMVARMIAASKAAPKAPKAPPAPPAPKAKAPPAPVVKAAPVAPKAKTAPGPFSVAARLSAAHGVTITRKGKRAA